MRKRLWLCLLVLSVGIMCLFMTACGNLLAPSNNLDNSPQSIRARGKLVAAVSVYPPFVDHEPQTQRQIGYDIELAQAIASKIGVPLEIREVQFTSLIPTVQSGQADIALGALYITPARKALVDFSVPYLETGIVLVAKKNMANVDQQLNGKVVGVKAGGTSERLANDLKNKHVNIVIKSYREAAEYLQDLENGRIDVALNDLLNQLEYNKMHKGLAVVGERLTSDSLGIAVRKENEKLLKIIDTVIVEMRENGESNRLYQHWLDSSNP